MATETAIFTIDTVIVGAGIRFLYQILQEQISGVHTTVLSKTTSGTPLTKSLWIPPSTIQWYLAISYDGTNFGDNIEIAPNQAYRLSAAARALRITIPDDLIDNQELIKDGDAGDFVATTDSLHDIRAYLSTALSTLSAAITGTHTITAAHGTVEQTIVTFTPTRNLPFEAYFDVNALIAASEGGLVKFRLKTEIDGAAMRTIDLSSFLVGTDEIHPVLEGFSDIGVNTMSLTVQCSIAVSSDRIIPYRIST